MGGRGSCRAETAAIDEWRLVISDWRDSEYQWLWPPTWGGWLQIQSRL